MCDAHWGAQAPTANLKAHVWCRPQRDVYALGPRRCWQGYEPGGGAVRALGVRVSAAPGREDVCTGTCYWSFFRCAIGACDIPEYDSQGVCALAGPLPRQKRSRRGTPLGVEDSVGNTVARVAVFCAHEVPAPLPGVDGSTNVLNCQVLDVAGEWPLAPVNVLVGKQASHLCSAHWSLTRPSWCPHSVKFEGRTVLRAQCSRMTSIRSLEATSAWWSGSGPCQKLKSSTSSVHGSHAGSHNQNA
jgi:hypothetical protein